MGFKIYQTFVTEKIIVLMAASVYKWFLIIPVFALFQFHPGFELKKDRGRAAGISETGDIHGGKSHPFYVCVTEINHNASDKTLEISCKIFADDFEKVLTQKFKTIVNLSQPKDKSAVDKWILWYIGEHLSFKADGKQVSWNYLGFEKEENAVYCYLQVDNISSVKKIELSNTMLHDLNNNQVNIMHVTVGGNRKSLKLDFPDAIAVFNF